MQTFLPYDSFDQTAKCLDYRRLGKQRVEGWQIYNVLQRKKTGEEEPAWGRHPAVLMWKGYENALLEYLFYIVEEWKARGYKHNMKIPLPEGKIIYPKWLGNEDFHASHRSNLLRKNFEFYSKYKWKEKGDLPYIWPPEEEEITFLKTL